MVIFLLQFFLSVAHTEDFRLEVKPSSHSIYQGEQLTLNYALVGKTDSAEVEVSKFPEFRGYWSENLLLRQGPILLIPESLLPPSGSDAFQEFSLADLKRRFSHREVGGIRKGMIGTYILTPMVGKADLKIEPMKIIVKNGNSPVTSLESPAFALQVKELPPVPASIRARFTGAVGHFSLNWERTDVPFRANEPVLLRMTVTGQGNFSEINSFPLGFDSNFEILSQKSTLHGSGQYSAKVFETVVSLKSAEATQTQEGKFIFFNPSKKQYETLTIPALHFHLLPAVVVPEADELDALQPRTSERASPLFLLPGWAWLLQLVFFLALVFDLVRSTVQEKQRRSKEKTRPFFRLYEQAQTHLKQGDVEEAEASLYVLAQNLINATAKSPFSRTKQLAEVEERWGREVRKQIENFLLSFERARYHPDHTPMQATEIYLKSFKPTLKAVA